MQNLPTFFRKTTIPFFVFITGACVLIIEILAIRILSPYFGNTIFSISSVISVVLAALSIGYYVGGKLADKYPKEELFFAIIAMSGFCVIFLHISGIIFLSIFGYKLSIVQGPIIASLLLFFFQSFLLGMLSPFAIKLQTMRSETIGIGSVSGGIFFWSTLGSIFGSLSAGFFLIPNFGINKVIISIGFLLMILGVFPILKINIWYKLFLIILLACSLFFFGFYLFNYIDLISSKSWVYNKDGVYQKIVISDGQYKGQLARFLYQDRNLSAVEFIDSSGTYNELAADYTKYYALYQVFNPNIKQALMIGGGAYSVPKALLDDLPNVTIDIAEIEPSLFDLNKKYFGLYDDPRLNNFIADGRRLLYDSQKKYDMIFSDAYSSFYSTPDHLTTQEFFKIAKERLNNNGVFIANVIGNLSFKGQSFLFSEMKTFKTVFSNSHFFAVNSIDSSAPQNIIFVGYNSTNNINFEDLKIKNNKNIIISGLSKKEINVNKFDFSLYPILTDDYAPVEYLIARELKSLKY